LEDKGDLSNHNTTIAATIEGRFEGTRPTTPEPGDKKFTPKPGHQLLQNFLGHPSLQEDLPQILELIECPPAQICGGTDEDECQCKEPWKNLKDRDETIRKNLPERAINETFSRETVNGNHICDMLNRPCRYYFL